MHFLSFSSAKYASSSCSNSFMGDMKVYPFKRFKSHKW
uniref:Uncharacterized protein n=1 Tax=Rhizophora mucronata TaxID=61149 RepID=A0A2P2NXD5_RHIMU